MNELLFEVSEYAPKKLREMEKTIDELKKNTSDSKTRAKFIQQIKEFTKINEIALFLTDDFNAGVISMYKKTEIKNVILELFNKCKDTKIKTIDKNELKKITSVIETSNLVDKIYIFIGKPLLYQMNSKEMVAILLHEFGHVYSTTTNVPDIIMNLFEKITQYFIVLRYVLHLSGLVQATIQLMYLGIFLQGIIHGIKFTQRLDEYKADNYTLKYGYADELISAINKFNFKEKVQPGFLNSIKYFSDEIVKIFKMIFMPGSHPTEENRIKNLEKQIFNKYRQLYPNYKEIIDVVHADYKKQVEV